MASKLDLSLIIPVHNEETSLEGSVSSMHGYLSRQAVIGGFEILLVLNGCTDASLTIARTLSARLGNVRVMEMRERGLGRAIKAGAMEASFEAVMFYAVDLPFGLDVIGGSAKAALDTGAIVIGSKGHPMSKVRRGIARTLFSATISTLNNALFGLGVKDTQGSILFYKGPLLKYAAMMDNPGAFFQTQILIYGALSGKKLLEIPVVLGEDMRKTRFSLARDGYNYIRALFAEYLKIRSMKR